MMSRTKELTTVFFLTARRLSLPDFGTGCFGATKGKGNLIWTVSCEKYYLERNPDLEYV